MTATRSMPLFRAKISNVKRDSAENGDMPTQASSSPSTPMASPLNWLLADTLEMQVRPIRIRAHVSSGPNCKAKTAICGAAKVRITHENTPPKIDAVVHSAGITRPACSILDMPVEEWENVIKVNLTGAFFLAKACIPPMLKAGQGAMVLFSSRAAKTGFAALGSNGAKTKAHYCASKAGVISLVKSLAMELAPYGIRANGVAPGPVQGTMIPKESWPVIAEKVPLNRLGTPEEMAEGAWFLCSPQAAFITGHILDINGGTLMD